MRPQQEEGWRAAFSQTEVLAIFVPSMSLPPTAGPADGHLPPMCLMVFDNMFSVAGQYYVIWMHHNAINLVCSVFGSFPVTRCFGIVPMDVFVCKSVCVSLITSLGCVFRSGVVGPNDKHF